MHICNWKEIRLFNLLCPEDTPDFRVNTKWDLPNQRVIHIDVERTRSEEILQSEKVLMENILTFYCKQTSTSYKQGMNEVLVPFILICRQGIPQSIAYTCFKSFIDKSLKTMFSDHTFRPLQMMFNIISLLLKYHSPKLSNFFFKHQISPEIYSTSWLLTMFSVMISDIFLLFDLWEEIVLQNDVFYPCYVTVALLDLEGLDLARNEIGLIPISLNRLKINDKLKLQEVIEKSKNFKKIVPVSVSTKLKQYDVYDLQKIDAYIEGLKESICLPVLPREIMLLVYPESKICNCKTKCSLCDISYPVIIIDCRAQCEQKLGHFPNTTFITDKDLRDLSRFPEQFLNIRGIYHLALMGADKNDTKLVKTLAQHFLEYEFPYISIIEGGFYSCHQFAVLFKLEINNHKLKFCTLCKDQSKIKLNKKFVSFSFVKSEPVDVEKRFECHLQGIKNKKICLVLAEKQIILVDGGSLLEKYEIRDLVKISTNFRSKKTLTFEFIGLDHKKKLVFDDKNHAKECLKEVTLYVRSLQSR